jgi:hypothetical protein
MAASIAALLPCSPVSLLGLAMGIWSLVALNRRNVVAAFVSPTAARGAAVSSIETATRPAGADSTPRPAAKRSNAMVWVAVVLVVLLLSPCLILPVVFVGYWRLAARQESDFGGGHSTTRATKTEQVMKRAEPARETSPGWVLRSDGPALTDVFAQVVLKLPPEKTERVNQILQAAYREFLTVEQQNTEKNTDDAGHTQVTIKPFPDSIARLENGLWSQLDDVLDPQQQETARLNLRLDPSPIQPPISLRDLVGPGFFGWGKEGAGLEFWRVGTWHHWKVQTRGYVYESRAPQLPDEYQRFVSPSGP